MTSTTTYDPAASADAPGEVLAAAREQRAIAAAAELRLFQLAVEWAALHSVDSLDQAALLAGHGLEDALPVAGAGAPLVAEFCIPEFATAIGKSHDAGRSYLGEAVETRYRLPRLWGQVVAGRVLVWR